jgi:hypothetical protein
MAYQEVWELRRRHGIVQTPMASLSDAVIASRNTTWQTEADFVHHKCAQAPSIFFTLNAP